MKRLRFMWGENGDFLSLQYASTNSTISEVTKTSKQSMKGKISHKIVSLKRFYKNNISSKEELRQETIDLLLSRHQLSTNHGQRATEKQLMQNEHEFSSINTYRVGFMTWNLAGKAANPMELDFSDTIKPRRGGKLADIFIMGFQETIPLNAITIMKGHDKDRN